MLMTFAEKPQFAINDSCVCCLQYILSFGKLFCKMRLVISQLSDCFIPKLDSLVQLNYYIVFIFQFKKKIVVLLTDQVEILFHPIDLLHQILHTLSVTSVHGQKGLDMMNNRLF
jgi:hypothetical protein